jgi:HlyD family secretion protein
VERGDLRTTVTATGTLNAVVTVEVGSQLSGQIAELYADFNDEVTKDQALAELDASTFAARVREAEAALRVAEANALIEQAAVARAEADLDSTRAGRAVDDAKVASARAEALEAANDRERKRALLERRNISDSEVDRAIATHQSSVARLAGAEAERALRESTIRASEAALRMAEADLLNARATVQQRRAALDQAQIDVARTVIRAPIDGIVIGRDVDRGQTVAASLEAPTLFTIAQDLRRMEVHAKIDEADIGRIRVGQRAVFSVDAFPGQDFVGIVAQIRKAPQVIQNVVTYTVLMAAENPELLLLPGMTAIVEIVVEEVTDVLKLANAALRFRPPPGVAVREASAAEAPREGTPAVVWVRIQDGVLTPVQVGLGTGDTSASELVDGPLGEGDPVIVGTAPAAEGGWFFGLSFGL